ncbi:MAG: beta-ketoacyl-ACP synthase III [bacterium]|nr:beta-ketoacyl-ACP synthase III [bacterium]
MKRAKIVATGKWLPERVLTNIDLEGIIETSDEWITTRTGIKERRIAPADMAASDMAYLAVKDIVKNEPIDLIIVSTSTPDTIFPSTACRLSEKLGLSNCACFDLSAACTGFSYALECGRRFIETGGSKCGLIIASEATSKFINWKDRSTCVLFGDGAGAVLLKPVEKGGIIGSYFNTNGKLGEILKIPAGGSKMPASAETVEKNLHTIQMDGPEVFKYAVLAMSEAIERILSANSLSSADISLFIPHQANLRIINLLSKRLKIPEEKMFVNLDRYGNMMSASQPIALDEAIKSKRIKEGDLILMVAVGGGFTYSSTLIEL